MTFGEGYTAGTTGLLMAVETAKQIGANEERKRIIKLLETHRAGFAVLRGSGQVENLADSLIALIKGENK